MWKDIEDNKKCLEMWEKEAECWDRKKTFKQMAKVDKKETEKVEKKSYRSLYSPFQGVAVLSSTPAFLPRQRQIPPPDDVQKPDSTNQRSDPSQTPPTALPVYGDRAAGGLNDDATSSSSLGPTDFAKICQHCGGDLRLTSTDWHDVVNAAYVNALNTLLNALRTAFPNKIDISKITGCKQQQGETVGDFLTRLTVLFNQHSGIPIPDNPGNQPGAHEPHLKQAFLIGLLPPLRADVGHTCIGLEDARLTEVRRHSEHAERQHKETKDKTQQKKIHQLQKAQLTMMQAVSALSRPHRQDNADNRANFTEPGRGGRGRGRGRGLSRQLHIPRDECYICRQKGHWARDCPQQREEGETRTFTAN